jgi:hypothetical protein
MFNTAKFFFQLPVFSEYYNRIVVISERGLKVLNVALIGFQNSLSFG